VDELDQLILAAISGDERAADRVLSRHYDELHAMVAGMMGEVLRRHYPAEDIVQEVAVEILRSIHTLEVDSDPTRCFWAWMRAVALNVVRNFGRRAKRSLRRLETDMDNDDGPSPSRLERRRERLRHLSEAVQSLSESDRQVVEMHYFRGMTLAEIATELGQTRPAVNARLMRARPKLREWLGSTSMNLSSS